MGLGFSSTGQPQISTFTLPLVSGGSLSLTGTRFRGISGASGGNSQDSPSDCPVVQLRSMENGQTLFLRATNSSATSYVSAPVTGLSIGWVIATVFVNGIPSTSVLTFFGNFPEINIAGNNVGIPDGDTTPSLADHTDFGSAPAAGATVIRTYTMFKTWALARCV